MQKQDEKEIREIINSHIKHEESKFTELLEEMKAIRADMAPIVEIYTNSLGAYKVITGFLKLAALVAAGIGALIFIRNKW